MVIIGFTVLIIGIAMIVLPGPATLVIPIGLALLATEFVWARKTLSRFQNEAHRLKSKLTSEKK
ncbi:MAG: PGPGW domain-containing protein [bacterium]